MKIKRPASSLFEHGIAGVLEALEYALFAENVAARSGWLQGLDARVKLLGLGSLLLAAMASRRLAVVAGLLLVALALAVTSRIPLRTLLVRAWLTAGLLTLVIGLPAVVTTPGQPLLVLPDLHWTVTRSGVHSLVLLLVRVETSTTLALLLVLATPWNRVLKALRSLGVPAAFVLILGLTYRYLFILLRLAENLVLARRSRLVATPGRRQTRQLLIAQAGVLLDRSLQQSDAMYQAMLSRGFRGEMLLLDEPRLLRRDWAALSVFLSVAALALWLGRS